VSVKVKASAKQEIENRAYKKLCEARFRFQIVSKGIGSTLEHDELPTWDMEDLGERVSELNTQLSQAASDLAMANAAYAPYQKPRYIRRTRMRRRSKKTLTKEN